MGEPMMFATGSAAMNIPIVLARSAGRNQWLM
jgi:hypothetical protein